MWSNNLFFILILILALTSCDNNKKIDVSKYYCSFEDSKTTKIYEYQSPNKDSLPPYYWSFKAIETDTGKYLVSRNFNYSFIPQQRTLNEIVSNGILAKEHFFYSTNNDSLKEEVFKARIISPTLYPFQVSENGGFFPYEIKFTNPDNKTEKVRLLRERKYLRDTIYTYKGKDIPAILFEVNDLMQFKDTEQGDYDHYNHMTEIYAEDLGLVYKQYRVGTMNIVYHLSNILSVEEFKKKSRLFWSKQLDYDFD